jgi:hypothetical protein
MGDAVGRVLGQKVGDIVQVVGPAGDRRAEIAAGDVPVGDAVVELQQRAVEGIDGGRVGEVDRLAPERMRPKETLQLRAGLDQAGKIIGRAVRIARVQVTLGMG